MGRVCLKFLQYNHAVSARCHVCNCWFTDIFVQYLVMLMICRHKNFNIPHANTDQLST